MKEFLVKINKEFQRGDPVYVDDFNVQGEEYWKYRPATDLKKDWNQKSKNWIEDYWDSKSHPHREMIIQAVKNLEPVETILEIGCNVGVNLALLKERFPYLKDSDLCGIDVNKLCIDSAKKYLPNMNFAVSSITNIPFLDLQFDIVLADAVLMYISPERIKRVAEEMIRVCRKAIIIMDWDSPRSIMGKMVNFHWARHYKGLFESYGCKVIKRKITEEEWPTKTWFTNGYIYIILFDSASFENYKTGFVAEEHVKTKGKIKELRKSLTNEKGLLYGTKLKEFQEKERALHDEWWENVKHLMVKK